MEKQQLKEKYFGKHYANQEKQKRIAKMLLISGLALGGLYLSGHLLNGLADIVRAWKNLRDAVMK